MHPRKLVDSQGNAVVEFLAFALVLLAPVTFFSVSQSLEWATKSELQATAMNLARAYAIGGQDTFEAQRSLIKSQEWAVIQSINAPVIEVTVRQGSLEAVARSVF